MTLSPRRIGCDISKGWLDVFDTGTRAAQRLANRPDEIAAFLSTVAPGTTIVFEATAPYDLQLRRAIDRAGLGAVRVNPSRARAFARAAGYLAKTDAIDARMLAAMPAALAMREEPAIAPEREALLALNRRRDQLVAARAVERGRIADEPDPGVRESLARHIRWLDGEIAALEAEIADLLATEPFAPAVRILRSVKGVGAVTTATLLALLPELGKRSAKAIAALAGLAPLNRDSGAARGERRIGPGRRRVRRALYMAALGAIRSIPRFKAHYRAIKARSGHAKVAIIAVARKLLVTLNAMLRAGVPFKA